MSYEEVLEPPYNPVAYWAKTTFWPNELGEKSFRIIYGNINDENIPKPRNSSIDRLDCMREEMAKCGIHMEGPDLIHNESRNLFQSFLTSDHTPSKGLGYPVECIPEILRLHHLLGSTKARVQKDITPWVVPSAQDLFFRRETTLDYIDEAIQEEWGNCETMGSSRPQPDYVVGLSPNKAFTDDEIQRLKTSASSATLFFFTRQLCFPFLICEVRAREQGLEEADQQNIHSGSIAVRAIIGLYQAAFGAQYPDRVNKLYGQVLAFTISHDDRRAKLYGHYAVVSDCPDGMPEFRRHHIGTYSFTRNDGAERFTAYKFVLNIYDQFAPLHLKRIKDAAASLPWPVAL
jgi:hypothetical protein